MSAGHAEFAPSSAARVMACPGSHQLCKHYPEEETIASREGTAAHWAAAEMLRGRVVAVGQCADNGVTLTDEMVEGAESYASDVLARDYDDMGDVEVTLRSDFIQSENWGTPDYCKIRLDHVWIDDFKFGHEYVNVRENWQLINYAALAVGPLQRGDMRVTLRIHQPRSYHRDGPHRVWETTYADLMPKWQKMREYYTLAARADAPVVAGNECKNCAGRHACEAAAAAGYEAAGRAYACTPLTMSPAAVGLELRTLIRARGQLNARISGLEEHAKSLIKQGTHVPFNKLEFGKGRTVWRNTVQEVIDLGLMFGVDVAKPGTVTPLQAKVRGKLIPGWEDVIEQYSHAPNGSVELVEDDGKDAARIFTGE